MRVFRSAFPGLWFAVACTQGAARCPDSVSVAEPPPESATPTPPAVITPPSSSAPQVEPPPEGDDSVKAFNEWAYRFNEQRDLPLLLTYGIPRYEDTDFTVVIDYEDGESPDAAVATVTQERFLDDSVFGERIELRFIRFDCPSCKPGPTRWRLESRRRLIRCYEGRGHQDYSEERCN
jgi:hypothetical protein